MNYESICVVGLGYIGLPTASLLATKGFPVHGVDVNPTVVETINSGQIHIREPDLDVLAKFAVQSKRLWASDTPAAADVFVIAVPTPLKDNQTPDMSCVEAAAKSIAPCVKPHNLVILESTCPVGATEQVAAWIQELRPDLKIPRWAKTNGVSRDEALVYFAHCSERVLPGQVLNELVNNDRVIGGINPQSARRTEELYRKFVNGELLLTDSRTAELCKLSENAFRDVNIAFANELSLICEQLHINVWELIKLANHHPRVKILEPGPGVGGHSIAVDPWFIVSSASQRARLIRTARVVNDSKPHFVLENVLSKAQRFKHPVIACLGLAFKGDVDDLRESPSVEIVHELARSNIGKLMVVEPYVRELPKCLAQCAGVELVPLSSALEASDIVLLLVNHRVFVELDRSLLRDKIVIDTRGIWS